MWIQCNVWYLVQQFHWNVSKRKSDKQTNSNKNKAKSQAVHLLVVCNMYVTSHVECHMYITCKLSHMFITCMSQLNHM